MNIFPESHNGFIEWATAITKEINSKSGGTIRLSHNRMASVMAKNIPGTDKNFNINTLKSIFDKETPKATKSSKQSFSEMFSDDMFKIFSLGDAVASSVINCTPGNTPFDMLNENDSIGELYADLHRVSEEQADLIKCGVGSYYFDTANKIYPKNDSKTPNERMVELAGFAYRELIKDAIYESLESAALFVIDSDLNKSDKGAMFRLNSWLQMCFRDFNVNTPGSLADAFENSAKKYKL